MTKRNIKFLISLIGFVILIIIICMKIKFDYDKYLVQSTFIHGKHYDWSGYEWIYEKDDTAEYVQSDKQIITELRSYFPKATDSIYCLNDIKKLDWRNDNNAHWYTYYNGCIDAFSDESNVAIYFPLYDRQTKKRESFIILSTGLDGKQNNFIADEDTLFIDDWQNKLKLYNPNHPYVNACDSIRYLDEDGMVKFNLFNLLFGCKDQLLQVGRTNFKYQLKSEEEMAIIRKKIDKILEERKKKD